VHCELIWWFVGTPLVASDDVWSLATAPCCATYGRNIKTEATFGRLSSVTASDIPTMHCGNKRFGGK